MHLAHLLSSLVVAQASSYYADGKSKVTELSEKTFDQTALKTVVNPYFFSL